MVDAGAVLARLRSSVCFWPAMQVSPPTLERPSSGSIPTLAASLRGKWCTDCGGDAFPGIVTDDTSIFTAARQHGLVVETFDVLMPELAFQFFVAALGDEQKQSQYSYGLPNGDGDCNCITWIERLGLPLLTGRMDEFIALPGRASYPSRRFGRCL
jgi:hypothetical protein